MVTSETSVLLFAKTDALDIAIAAILNQNARPIAFFSRTMTTAEKRYSAVEKKAYVIN